MSDVYVLNPDYGLRDDIHRFILFSKANRKGNASPNWMSFIHPAHAAMLSFFTHERSLNENWPLLALFFHCDASKAERLIRPFMENREAFFTTMARKENMFPQAIDYTYGKGRNGIPFSEITALHSYRNDRRHVYQTVIFRSVAIDADADQPLYDALPVLLCRYPHASAKQIAHLPHFRIDTGSGRTACAANQPDRRGNLPA